MRVSGFFVTSIIAALLVWVAATSYAQQPMMIPPTTTVQYSEAFHALLPEQSAPVVKTTKTVERIPNHIYMNAELAEVPTEEAPVLDLSDSENQPISDSSRHSSALSFISKDYLFRVIIGLGLVLVLLFAFTKWVLPRWGTQVQEVAEHYSTMPLSRQQRVLPQQQYQPPVKQQVQAQAQQVTGPQSLFSVLGYYQTEPELKEEEIYEYDPLTPASPKEVSQYTSKPQPNLMKYLVDENTGKMLQPKVLSKAKLGPGKEIHIVQVGNRMLAIGSTAHNVTLLTEVDSPSAEDFVNSTSNNNTVEISEEKAVYQKYLTPPSQQAPQQKAPKQKKILPPFSPSQLGNDDIF